jgi:hypothetical protein
MGGFLLHCCGREERLKRLSRWKRALECIRAGRGVQVVLPELPDLEVLPYGAVMERLRGAAGQNSGIRGEFRILVGGQRRKVGKKIVLVQ